MSALTAGVACAVIGNADGGLDVEIDDSTEELDKVLDFSEEVMDHVNNECNRLMGERN